jgi:hypothetical protein
MQSPTSRRSCRRFDCSRYKTLCDVGGANGLLCMLVAQAHPHMRCISADLPAVIAIAARKIQAAGLDDRVSVQALDFFNDPLPRADVVTMGMILHDWNFEKKMHLVKAAYNALPAGGAFVAIENIIDDARRDNAFGLMMSLNMLIEFGEAFDFTGADFDGWCRQVGFRETEVIHLAGPASAAEIPAIASMNCSSRSGLLYSSSNIPARPCFVSFCGLPVQSFRQVAPEGIEARVGHLEEAAHVVRTASVEELRCLGGIAVARVDAVAVTIEESECDQRVEEVRIRAAVQAERPFELRAGHGVGTQGAEQPELHR